MSNVQQPLIGFQAESARVVSAIAATFRNAMSAAVVCPKCGYCRLRHEGACPCCAADARLADALAALNTVDDYEAIRAAASAIEWAIEPYTMGRRSTSRPPSAVRTVKDPIFTGDDGDDD